MISDPNTYLSVWHHFGSGITSSVSLFPIICLSVCLSSIYLSIYLSSSSVIYQSINYLSSLPTLWCDCGSAPQFPLKLYLCIHIYVCLYHPPVTYHPASVYHQSSSNYRFIIYPLSINLSNIYLPVIYYLSVNLLSVYLSICLSIYLSIYLSSISLSMFPPLCPLAPTAHSSFGGAPTS